VWTAPTRFKTLFIKPASKIISRASQNWAKLSLLVHTSMPPLGTDGVGGDLSKGPVAMDPVPRDTPAGTLTNSTSPSPGTRTPDGARTPGSDKNAIGQSTAHTSPIESAALRSRVIALENELAEAKTLAANPSSVELAALRSKSISLEAELELAKTDGAKSEEAMGGMLRMQRAMSSAQKAKITQLHEQNAALEAQITALKGQVQEARAAAEDADSSREELRREAERFESHVNEALDQKEAEWERANDTAVRRVQAELAQTKELTRKMLLAHAAAKLRWAAERASLIEEGASRSSMNSAAAVIGREARRAAETNAHGVDNRALASDAVASTAPGTALHALLAATTRRKPAEGATTNENTDEDDQLVAELLRDAMEEEVAAAIERGYYVDDAAGGAIVVGANAIVEKIVAKYKSTEGGPDGRGVGAEKDREPEPVAEVRTPGHTPIDVDDAEDDTEEDTWWKERAVLVAELARARAATEVAEARAATKDSEANEEESYASTAAAYEAEEASAVAALELAAEVRAARLELELEDLRRRMVSPTQLRNVLGEIKELRAKTEALKSGCVMTQRLVKPTIESAIACLRLDATAGTRAAMDDAATGVQATSERSPRVDAADASTAGSSMAPHRSSRSTGPHQSHQPIPPSAAAARAPVFNARAGTPHTPADSSYRESLRTPTDESIGTSGVRTEDLPETFRTAMDGLGFSSTLRKSAAVLVAEAEADAAKRSLASAAKKALASIMDSPAGGTKHR